MEDLIKQTVRNLRKNQTKSETIIWQAVRNRNLNGKKFLRQHPIRFEMDGGKRFFVADFYCHEKKLVVEIDGKIHLRQKDYDELRTQIINALGMKVIRFRNEEVEENLEQVLERLRQHL
ncbi:MAG: endonuclease domain-containing protein [bacterium]